MGFLNVDEEVNYDSNLSSIQWILFGDFQNHAN